MTTTTLYETILELTDALSLADKARLIGHLGSTLHSSLHEGVSSIQPPAPDQALDWHDFIDQMAGSLAHDPIDRPPQPPLETREALE